MTTYYVIPKNWRVAYHGEHNTPEEAAQAAVQKWIADGEYREFAVPPKEEILVSDSVLPVHGLVPGRVIFEFKVGIRATYTCAILPGTQVHKS